MMCEKERDTDKKKTKQLSPSIRANIFITTQQSNDHKLRSSSILNMEWKT